MTDSEHESPEAEAERSVRTSQITLKAASPDLVEFQKGRPAFFPGLPWKLVLGVAMAVGIAFLIHRQGERRESARMKADIERVMRRISSVTSRYQSLHNRMTGWVSELAHRPNTAELANTPGDFVNPNFRFSSLHDVPSLYVRIRRDQASNVTAIEEAILTGQSDDVGRCLGIRPMLAQGLIEQGSFLTPRWIARVRRETDRRALDVYREQLRVRVTDLPVLETFLRARYLIAVIQHTDSRTESPVDVGVWDLRSGSQVFLMRRTVDPHVVTTRVGDSRGPSLVPPSESSTATDCAIAAQMRALAGD